MSDEKQNPDWDDDNDENYIDDEHEMHENEEDEFERAMDECGQTQDGGCMLAGTEYCDWDCPFSKQMWANLSKKRDSKGRYTK